MEILKDLHIIVKNEFEKFTVVEGLKSIGFEWGSGNDKCLHINACHKKKYFMTVVDKDIWPDSEVLTANQFMEKYVMTELQKTIEAAKKQGYTNKTLSNALGKYDGYIARIISKQQSEKLQKFLIKEINELLVPAPIEDAMMISKEEYKTLNDHNANLLNDNSIKSHQISELTKELSHKNQVLDKRNDKYNLLEGEFNKLTQDKEGLIRTINELEQQNKRVVDSNFELNDAISLRDATIDTLSKKLDASYENYSMRSSMHITSENKRKKERFWFVGITVALLVLFVISHLV